MESLLGQFYTRIKGSQEVIASDGLTYILQRSKAGRIAIRNIIQNECGIELDDITYSSQNTGEKGERPDISGFDTNGKEVLIIETKFWSSLTENQPLEYLNRLESNSVLIFICPNLRVRTIYDEILRRINFNSTKYVPNNEAHSIVLPEDKYILIKTWNEILGILRVNLSQENNQNLLSDIDQIIGFCEIIDKNTFLPIQSDELSPKFPKRINSYYDLIDKIVGELKKIGKFDTKGLLATPQRWGYTRYGRINNFALSLDLNFEFWSKHADTPFWIGVQLKLDDKKDWVVTKGLERSCKNIPLKSNAKLYFKDKIPYFPLFPLINETEDLVIKNISEQIISLINAISNEIIVSNQ